jgi:hypothetical protein
MRGCHSVNRADVARCVARAGVVVLLSLLDRADILVRERALMVVPAAYFDQFVASLDEPEDAPGPARAAATVAEQLSGRTGLSGEWLAGVHWQPEDERKRGGDWDQARPRSDRERVRRRMTGEG